MWHFFRCIALRKQYVAAYAQLADLGSTQAHVFSGAIASAYL